MAGSAVRSGNVMAIATAQDGLVPAAAMPAGIPLLAQLAGAVTAFYQIGYGIAAFGTGPLTDAGVDLRAVFGFAAIAAVIMGILSFPLSRKDPASTAASAPTS